MSAPKVGTEKRDLPDLTLLLLPTTPTFAPALNPTTKQMESISKSTPANKSTDAKHSLVQKGGPILVSQYPKVEKVFEEHARAWHARDVEGFVATFASDGDFLYVANGTGARGHVAIRLAFQYLRAPGCFAGVQMERTNTIISPNSIVLEESWVWTHSTESREVLPGIAPSGRVIRLPVVVIITLVDPKPSQPFTPLLIQSVRIYWDQACALDQVAGKVGDNVHPLSAPTNDKVPELSAKIKALGIPRDPRQGPETRK